MRYANRFFQLDPESRNYASAKGKVVVWERPDGQVGIEYRGGAVRWREIAAPARPITQEKRTTAVAKAAKKKWVAPMDHPWREAARRQVARRAWQQEAAVRGRSWALPSAAG